MMEKKCCIIGSGLGGLSAAVKAAQSGVQVDVYEQNPDTGGKANRIIMENFYFDSGPSIVTLPFILESLFKELNKDIADYLTIQQLDKHCKYFYRDGSVINAFSDIKRFGSELDHKTIDDHNSLLVYLNYCKKIYRYTHKLFLFRDFHELSNLFTREAWQTLFNIWKIDPFRSMHKANASFFKDEKTIQLFDRYATFNGSSPYLAPATLNIIPHVECNMGSYIIREGIYAIPRALTQLAKELGVSFHTNTPVDSILLENNAITGISVQNKKIPFDMIISNVDVTTTYLKLLNNTDNTWTKKDQKQPRSTSALIFYWGIDTETKETGIHNIIFSQDYPKEFRQLFHDHDFPDQPTIYIYISSKFNKSHAPRNMENWYVMINAPAYRENSDWKTLIPDLRKLIITGINATFKMNIEKHIIAEKYVTPQDIENSTGSFKGSLYGMASNSQDAAFIRHSNRSKKIKGLYFCGGSVHPGGGIPLVLLSGILAVKALKKYEKI